jgi:predicted anti-sigma-YlaC factor YlaD
MQKFFKTPVSNQTKQVKMNCSRVRKKLIFYAEGKLEGRESEQVSLHLADCKQCNHLYEELQSTLEIAEKRIPLEPNPFLYTRIKEKLEATGQTGEKTAHAPVYRKVLIQVVMSVMLMIGIYAGNRLGNFYENSQQQTLATSSTEYYINDMQQEKLEVLLLND